MSFWRWHRAVFEETVWCGLSLASLFTPTHTLTLTHTHTQRYISIYSMQHSQRLNKFLRRALLLSIGAVIAATKPLEMLVRLQLLPLHHLLCRAPCPHTSPNCHSFIHRCISSKWPQCNNSYSLCGYLLIFTVTFSQAKSILLHLDWLDF